MPPWESLDPPWTYNSAESLQAQALRKSRSKTAGPGDAMALDACRPPPQDRHPDAHDLWRWAPDFRMMAASGELGSRVQAHGREVWLVEPPPVGGATLVYQLPHRLDRIDWAEQVDAVLRAAVEREDRLPEILSQASTLWAFFESVCGISLDRAPTYRELILAAEDWALKLLMVLKHNVGARRPVELSSLVHPVIPTPGHGSVPSGHATLAAFNAEMLCLILYGSGQHPQRVRALDRLARRIAFNRVVAGVHFPADSQAGYILGHQLARALAMLAGHAPPVFRTRRAGQVLRAPYRLRERIEESSQDDDVEAPASADIAPPSAPAPILASMWTQAQAELARLRV